MTSAAMVSTILIADDSPLMRLALTEVLDAEADLRVVAAAGTADEAISLAATHQPTVAILDVHMPGNGLAAAAHIHRATPDVRIIVLTGDAAALTPPDIARLGLAHYLVKGVSNAEIIAAVRHAAGTRSTTTDH